MSEPKTCPECPSGEFLVNRRHFIRVVAAGGLAGGLGGRIAPMGPQARAEVGTKSTSENLVKRLYSSLSANQREEICFDWDYQDDRGLLRTHVSNNWNITDASKLNVGGEFFNPEQRELIREIFLGQIGRAHV